MHIHVHLTLQKNIDSVKTKIRLDVAVMFEKKLQHSWIFRILNKRQTFKYNMCDCDYN